MTARSRKSNSKNSPRPASAPRSSRPEPSDAAPPQPDADNTPMTEEHSEIVLREPRSARPDAGDDAEAPPTQRGVGLTVHDKSLRPSVLRWKSWQVSDSFREYAERAARGEKLPRFEGSILADPSRVLPMPSPDQSETARRRAYGIKSPPPSWMNPNSLVWNPWLWAAGATVFAVALFGFTLWYTTPREEVVWETNALTPAPGAPRAPARPAPEANPSLAARAGAASEATSSEPVDTRALAREREGAEERTAVAPRQLAAPLPAASLPAALPAAAPRLATAPAFASPPLATAAAPALKTQPPPTAVAPLAKAAPPVENDTRLGEPLQAVATSAAPAPSGDATATYPIPSDLLPPAAGAAPAAPAVSAVEGTDPLLVEAPSF